MPTNPYFDHSGSFEEQRLVEDLLTEAINMYGIDVYYIPRDDQKTDLVYGEDPLKTFTSAFPVEVYTSNYSGYQGQKEFFTKFGLEIRDHITVMISRRVFLQRVKDMGVYNRPKEGDLIYVPFLSGTGELYEITFVEDGDDFFTLGRKNPYFYSLKLEEFKFSQEHFDTGVDVIDEIITDTGYALSFNLGTGSGNYIIFEKVYQGPNVEYATATASVVTWNAPSSTLNVTSIMGEFKPNVDIIGVNSNANYRINTYDSLQNNQYDDPMENKVIENEANTIINISERNPFGRII